VVAIIILLGPSLKQYSLSKQQEHKNQYQDYYFYSKHYPVAIGIVYGVLLVVMVLVTISRMRFADIIKLVNIILGRKQELWRRVVINLCMIGAIVMAAFSFYSGDWYVAPVMISVEASTLVLVSFGNFQAGAETGGRRGLAPPPMVHRIH
jgi:hypothetical protein